ncbi:hypothetical protein LIER_32564 [Lithospermum erythrorhizon]|uniref:Uncharacterized protein n=1 Tax=Lithospermum erythrorhizon TaxID=34254 RepID=A0AAV3S032_LITER
MPPPRGTPRLDLHPTPRFTGIEWSFLQPWTWRQMQPEMKREVSTRCIKLRRRKKFESKVYLQPESRGLVGGLTTGDQPCHPLYHPLI